MDDDDILMEDDIVTLTRAQWEDLMRSIQSLSMANAKLVETIAFLLKQNLKRSAESLAGDVRLKDVDPYDLQALRKMVEEGG
jgi:hypothetical protein